jgi:hypothetical protein
VSGRTGETVTIAMPSTAVADPHRTVRTGPTRAAIRSTLNLPTVIAATKQPSARLLK